MLAAPLYRILGLELQVTKAACEIMPKKYASSYWLKSFLLYTWATEGGPESSLEWGWGRELNCFAYKNRGDFVAKAWLGGMRKKRGT